MKPNATILVVSLIGIVLLSTIIYALPAAPSITYISNSTQASTLANRSTDEKGTITTLVLSANQQNYRWKAYVGNVTGRLALDDADGYSIYDWNLGTSSGGKVLVSRFSNINWNNVSCANSTSIDTEQTAAGMSDSGRDSINVTFNATNHRSFNVSTTPISGCRSTATYTNDTAQPMSSSALFQEILLMDAGTTRMVYATIMDAGGLGYNNQLTDFQLIVAENESATVPATYYFWVELG